MNTKHTIFSWNILFWDNAFEPQMDTFEEGYLPKATATDVIVILALETLVFFF